MKPRHPSEKPVRNDRPKGGQIWRVPSDGYVTPRLREGARKDAIGFIHNFDSKDDE